MSKPNARSAPSIPTGILVSVTPDPEPSKRHGLVRRIPWPCIATGGSVAWFALLAVLLVSSSRPASGPPTEAAPPAEPIVAAASPSIPAAPSAGPAPVELEARPPSVEAPKLPPSEVKQAADPRVSPGLKTEPQPEVVEETTEVEEPKPQKVKRARPEQPAPKGLDLAVFANCEEIGTNVLFVKNPPEAFKRAKAENKLVFMVHLSGNLEDPGFT